MKTDKQVIAWAKQHVNSQHDSLDSRYEEIARLFRPNSIGFVGEQHDGNNLESEIYDSTPLEESDKMARNLFAWIMNPSTKWFTIEWQDAELKESDEAKEWLEEAVKEQVREMNSSNWSNKALQVIADLVHFGTAMPQVDEKPPIYDEDDGQFRGLLYKAHHMSCSFGDEGSDEFVHNTAVRLKFTAMKAAELYGEDVLPKKVKRALDKGEDTKFNFVHAIVRRRLPAPPENDVALPAEKRPYWSLHFFEEDGSVMKSDGYYELTRSMPRYSTTNDSVYGYSPAMKALPDARVLNMAQEKDLDAWDAAIEPPLLWDEKYLDDDEIDRRAGGKTKVTDVTAAVREMPGDTKFQAHAIRVDDKRASIRRIFLSDELDIPDRERVGQMTAFEVQKRVERILRSAGSVVTSIHNEFLQPMLFATFMMLLRRGVFPVVPKVVADKGGKDVLKVTLLGPLAKAQRSEDADLIRGFVGDVLALAGSLPPETQVEILDKVDMDTAMEEIADSQGVPQTIIRDKDEVEKRRNDRKEQAQRLAEAGIGPAGQSGPSPDSVPA